MVKDFRYIKMLVIRSFESYKSRPDLFFAIYLFYQFQDPKHLENVSVFGHIQLHIQLYIKSFQRKAILK